MKIKFQGAEPHILAGLNEFGREYGFMAGEGGLSVTFEKNAEKKLIINRSGTHITISVSEPVQIFRSLSLVLQNVGNEQYQKEENCYFDTNGPMIDVSQASSVLKPEACKKLLRMIAAMGLNTFMLYMEDTYEVEGEPFWGYMRPKYSQEELKEIDDYAYQLGIEVIPCIQTLSHLPDPMRWSVYREFSDDDRTFLVGDERTYQLMEKLIKTITAPLRSKRIHIGLDEAWGLGTGKYLVKNGYTSQKTIILEHIKRISEITDRLGLKPMMWNDMVITSLLTKTGEHKFYYDLEPIQANALDEVELPKNMQYIYWDYYHSYDTYLKLIEKNRSVCKNLVFAGCSRNTYCFGSHHEATEKTSGDALLACKNAEVREVFVTIWGDNNRESSIFAALPGLQIYAEHGYAEHPSMEQIKERFRFCTGADYDDIAEIRYFEELPGYNDDDHNLEGYSPSRQLLYQDILAGLFDKNFEQMDFSGHFRQLAGKMDKYAGRYPAFKDMFAFYKALANALEIKGEIGKQITKAYHERKKSELNRLCEQVLPELKERIEILIDKHREYFMNRHKALGWEIFDIRYGGVLARIRTAEVRLKQYLCGEIPRIEELEQERLFYDGQKKYRNSLYSQICSASRL